jgi:hypothetical protein
MNQTLKNPRWVTHRTDADGGHVFDLGIDAPATQKEKP